MGSDKHSVGKQGDKEGVNNVQAKLAGLHTVHYK